MKKLVALVLALALCLSLCSVALATPAPEEPSSCNVNILHAIGTYWIARTIIERAKEIKVETVNLSDFLKLALPVGIAAVGTAATVGIIYALLKGNGDKDVDTIKTVEDVLNTVSGGFPTWDDAVWTSGDNKCYVEDNELHFWNSWVSDVAQFTFVVTSDGNGNYTCNSDYAGGVITFTMENKVLKSITLINEPDEWGFEKCNGTYTAPPQ